MIELDTITKTYSSGYFSRDSKLAIDDASLTIEKGETLGLVGESGCGKSTLGRIAIRLLEPSRGKVWFDGIELTALSKSALRRMRPQMQIVFQDPDTVLDPRMTIGDSVAEPIKIWHQSSRHEVTDKVLELLDTVGLQQDLISRYPFELSGGQKQRVSLARALALDPEFLVADEPTSALDLSVQSQILCLLKNIKKRTNFTLLFISHDLQVIQSMADRVTVMKEGKILETQKTSDLFTSPKHSYTKQLIAASYASEAWFGKNVKDD
ncbi:MAG: ATP-binding cassette domain-containing protein [Methanospirillum sp.]|uniref:ATP-binding cassette domain-containing protein n=1 Tax=Methanospirillum sp. TaxID=45200 RepID=UPI002369DC14|nr:ATP-binding cassette domain-containing protein [Methanospirillum sp.]MDD1728260.1 ATP-binding cassette domain-containing protein [Methanospirillum sp.]